MAISGLGPLSSDLPPSGIVKIKMLRKLDEMERELQKLQAGIRDARAALARDDRKSLSSSVKNLGNWLLSLAESFAYIQAIRSTRGLGQQLGTVFFESELGRVFKLGQERGRLDGGS